MKISNIQINGFGNIQNKAITFEKGINLIYGDNEAGKSTIASFIKAMFYGVNKNKAGNQFSDLERFTPWNGGEFSGKIEYEMNGGKFIATREFSKNRCKVYDDKGNDITSSFNVSKARGTELGFEQFGIDEDTFENTIFISQKSVEVDEAGQKNVTQKITNMIQSGNESISYDKTKQKLQKMLLDEVGTERTHNKPLNTITREIGLLEENKEHLMHNREREQTISNDIKKVEIRETSVATDLEKANRVLEIKERYEKLLKERQNDHEIQVKIIEKEHEKKLMDRHKLKMNSIEGIAIVTILLTLVFLLLKWLSAEIIVGIIGMVLIMIVNRILSKNMEMPPLPNFDIVKEDFKKKEEKELYFLRKEGIGESLASRKLTDVRDLIAGLKKKKEDLILEKHKLNIEAESLKENVDRLNEIEERLEYLYEQEENLRKLEYSIKLSMDKLTESYEELKSSVVPKLEAMIKESISQTTNYHYTNIFYNENDGILVQNAQGDIVTIDKLSTGTIEQAYLGFRFAIAKETANLPIILDETFAYFDDERLENILQLLQKEYADRQVIILSCSTREKTLLEKLKIEYHFITLEK